MMRMIITLRVKVLKVGCVEIRVSGRDVCLIRMSMTDASHVCALKRWYVRLLSISGMRSETRSSGK